MKVDEPMVVRDSSCYPTAEDDLVFLSCRVEYFSEVSGQMHKILPVYRHQLSIIVKWSLASYTQVFSSRISLNV